MVEGGLTWRRGRLLLYFPDFLLPGKGRVDVRLPGKGKVDVRLSEKGRVDVRLSGKGKVDERLPGKGKVDVKLPEKRKVDVRLPGKVNSNSHGVRPIHLIMPMIKWFRTSRLSIKNVSLDRGDLESGG